MEKTWAKFATRAAQIILLVVLLHHLFLLFMMGGIFHGVFLPWIDPGHFDHELVNAILLLLPFTLKKPVGLRLWEPSVNSVQLLTATVFSAFVLLKSFNSDEVIVASGILTAVTPFIFLVTAPRILEQKHYLTLFWFVCILAGVHAVCQIGFVLGQTQVFCGHNVNMPHGRLIHVPYLPLLTSLDGYTGGWFTNPNCLASYIMAVPALSLFLSQPANTPSKPLRWLSLAIFVVSLLSLTLTFSRAAILSAMLGLIPLAVHHLRNHKIPPVVSVLAPLSLVIGMFLWQMRWTTLNSPFDLNGRQEIFKATWRSIKHMPFMGYGPFTGTGVIETPHNVYCANLLFYGIPGFLAFLAMIACSVWIAWAVVKRTSSTGLLALSGFLASYIFAYSQIEYVFTCPYSFSNSVALLLVGYFVFLFIKQPTPKSDVQLPDKREDANPALILNSANNR